MSSPIPPDPYKALNLPKTATAAAIRSAYKKLVLTCHPDKFVDEKIKAQKADEFHQVQQAYEILSDESKRARYDDRVKLAELRADLMQQTGSARRAAADPTSRHPGPIFETRGNAVYEERVPRNRPHDDGYTSPRYEDHRASTRRHEDHYEPPTPRRAAAHASEDRRRSEKYEEEEREKDKERARRIARDQAKAAEKSSHADRKKVRDKAKRQDSFSKHFQRADFDTDSDSDDVRYVATPRRASEPKIKRKHDEPRISRHEEPRKSKYDSDYSDDPKYQNAADYIAKVSGRPMDVDGRRRPSITRIQANRVPPPPPPPPSPPDVRRSSANRHSEEPSRVRASSTKQRAPVEIVDPPSSRREYEPRRPALHPTTSAPAHIKIPPPLSRGAPIPRAATMDVRGAEARQPASLRRSQTSPMANLANMVFSPLSSNSAPKSASKLRNSETHDSGYSSPGTPEMHPGSTPHFTTTKYAYVDDSETDDDRGPSPRITLVEPDHHRDRDLSPRSHHRVERPPMTSRSTPSSRVTPTRAHTLQSEPSPRTPTARAPSGRGERPAPDRLFGEVPSSYKVQYSPKYEASDISYSPRRSADSARDHKDAYAFTESRSGRGGAHPGMSGRGGSYAQNAY